MLKRFLCLLRSACRSLLQRFQMALCSGLDFFQGLVDAGARAAGLLQLRERILHCLPVFAGQHPGVSI